MSKLNIDQKSIKDLFSDNKADFLIPDYLKSLIWNKEVSISRMGFLTF